MADTGKRVEVRFGAFACAIEGYEDPVVQMREVLTLMQQMIRETPALADRASQFGDAEVARLEHALDHAGGHGDAAPGIVVIRGAGGEPEDAETVDELSPEAAGADGDVPGGPGAEASADVREPEPHSGLAAGAVGESEPEAALAGEDMPAAGTFGESEHPVPPVETAGAGGDGDPAEADAAARDWPADSDAEPAHAPAPLAAAAAEAAFSADIAAALDPADAFGGAERADEPAPELAAADETGEAVEGERVGPLGKAEVTAWAWSGMSEPAEPFEAAERQDRAEQSAIAGGPDSAGDAETVHAAGAPAAGGPSGNTLPGKDAVDAKAAYGLSGEVDGASQPTGEPMPDGTRHAAEEPGQPVVPDAASGPTAAADQGRERTTDEPEPEQASTGEGGPEQPATGDGEPERDDNDESDLDRDAVAASLSGELDASGAVEPPLVDGAAAGVAERDDEAPPAATGAADRLALNIFAPSPAGAAPSDTAFVNLFAPPPPAYASAGGASVRNIFAPPTGAEAPAREPAFAGAGPERAPANHRPKRAASLHDLETEPGPARASAYSIFAPDHEDAGEPAAEALAPASGRWAAAADEPERTATDANPAPAPRRPEGAGRFAALLGRIYGARAATGSDAPDAPEAQASVNAAAPDPVGPAKGPSAATLAARAGVRSVPDLLAASAAWLTLVDDKLRFSRREVMEVFETLPGPHERTLEARIKGFGKLVRAGTLVLIEEGVFSLSDAESDRYRRLLDRG